jgi:alkylation response protein AidB-like acyl-CoA dehydrogenase
MNGVSVLLIERSAGGVSTRKMDCQGVWSSGTTYITFEDVKVPVENLIGKENQGFKVVMTVSFISNLHSKHSLIII